MCFESKFVWTDLSTYDVEKAKEFYKSTFNWKFIDYGNFDEGAYLVSFLGSDAISGIYLLPEKFQQKNFPSFWMTYIHVSDVHETVKKVEKLEGAKIEFAPMAYNDGSVISLIRDPLGAGFTVYEGRDLEGRNGRGHGKPVWNELHISDCLKVKEFYEALFGWEMKPSRSQNEWEISLGSGKTIGHVAELPDDFRGGFEYWIPTFEVKSIEMYLALLEINGGKVCHRMENGRVIVQDSQEASFIVREKE